MKLSDKKRDNNIELLRICLMFMIVLLHLISHGLSFIPSLLNNSENTRVNYSHIFIFNFTVIGVNAFVLISGFYGIKFKLETLKSFWRQALMSSLIILIFTLIVQGRVEYIKVLKSFFPIISNYWWYLSTYVFLFLLAPFINSGLEKLSKKEFQRILFLLFICNCVGGYIFGTFNANNGYSVLNFIFLYFLGRYCSIFNIFSRIRFSLFIYILSLLVNFSIGLFLYNGGHYKYFLKFYDYNNPLIIFNALIFVILFFKIKVGMELRKFSQLTLGVYLFHDNDFVRSFLPSLIKNNNIFFLSVLGVLVFSGAALIEFFRQKLSNFIDFLISKK